MSGLFIPAGAVIVRDGAVLIGDCCCRAAVEELLIESLGPQDDDLHVDVLRGGGGAWETLSDTRLNVSAYNGETVSPGGTQGFNNAWATTGFRVLRFGAAAASREGDRIRVWTVDVGGGCRLSHYRITVRYADGTTRSWLAGQTLSVTPPAWPSGTIGPYDELLKTSAQRPWQAPGSPAIYVPNGEWTIPLN